MTCESVRAAIAGELRILEPAVRTSAALLDEFLDPEFTEIGASGQLWDRPSIIALLADGPPPAPVTVTDMAGRLLAPGLVHLTYVSDTAGRRARRSSLWRCTEQGWRVLFHQGTPSPGGDQRAL
ncbi:DUF4440 domain-containing protein [Nonomuraea sp. NPDC047897]|uniref:nuclear transport factor 2 family protein n=1 Tax=Nonomuraea sp. NPDC047897 TaxID=3364346 RepID=UPI003721B77D